MLLSHSRAIASKRPVSSFSILQAGATFCAIFIEWGTFLFIARILVPRSFGTYLFVQWLACVAIPLIGVGTTALASRRIAEIQSHETLRTSAGIFYFLWYRQCYSILIYCLLYSLFAYPLHHVFHICQPQLLLLAGLATLPFLLSSVVGITLRSLRRSDLLAILHLCGTISTLFLSFLACRIGKDHIGLLLLASSLAGTLTLIVALLCITHLLPLRQALRPGIFLKERLQQHIKGASLFFLCDVIVWQRSEVILLACWRKSDELAFYTISSLFSIGITQLAPLLFSLLIGPMLAHYFPQRRHLTIYHAFIRSSCYIGLLALILCILSLLFGSRLIFLLLGTDYLPLLRPLHILLISALFGSIASVSLTHLLNCEQKKIQLRYSALAAILNVLLALPCVALWGMMGAALACACAQTISAIGSIFLCSRLLKRTATSQLEAMGQVI